MDNTENINQKRDLLGKRCFYLAWFVEIILVFVGLFLTLIVAMDIYYLSDETAVINATLGALPFFALSLLEPTKIFLTLGLYRPKHFIWKIFIFVLLFFLTLLTFETNFTLIEGLFYKLSPFPLAETLLGIDTAQKEVPTNFKQVTIIIIFIALFSSTIGTILTFLSCVLRHSRPKNK